MPLVTRRHPFRLDTIHPSVLGDTHSAWFGRKWVGTRRERVLFSSGKDDDDANAYADADPDVLAVAYHQLLLHYLHVEHRSYEEERDDRVSATGGGGGRGSSCSSHRRPRLTSLAVDFDGEEDDDCNPTTRGGADVVIVSWIGSRADLAIDLHRYLPFLGKHTLRYRETDEGNTSPEVLQMLSTRRATCDFDTATKRNEDENEEDKQWHCSLTTDKASCVGDGKKSRGGC